MATSNNSNKAANKAAVLNVITLDNFTFAAGTGDYALDTAAGRVYITMTRKQSNFGSGALTVYDGIITAVDGTTSTVTEKPIGWWKKQFGAAVNHRDGTSAAAVRVLSESEISDKVAAFTSDLSAALERVGKVLARAYAADTAADLLLAVKAAIPADTAAAYRGVLLAANDKAAAAKAAADKAAAERADKATRKDAAKAVLNMDASQAAALAALIAQGVDIAALAASLAS